MLAQEYRVRQRRDGKALVGLQVGMMVATLVGGDEMDHPFWIAKITDRYY